MLLKLKKREYMLIKGLIAFVISLCMFGIILTKQVLAAEVSNPQTDSNGNMIYDCVWFGSYPQTEIVSENNVAQIKALEKMNTYYKTEYDVVSMEVYEKIVNASYDNNGDALVDGVKYRRIKKEDATFSLEDIANVYYSWIDDISYHYFRYEPIKWNVLSKDGTTATLLSAKGIDVQKYNLSQIDITWEKSTIRSWLNGYESKSNTCKIDYRSKNFIDTAFTLDEQDLIYTRFVDNGSSGNYTYDKITLLSASEAVNVGLSNGKGNRKSSTYAKAMGACSYIDTKGAGNAQWWLRSSGSSAITAVVVTASGEVLQSGGLVTLGYNVVCPVLLVDMGSFDNFLYAGTVSSNGNETCGHAHTELRNQRKAGCETTGYTGDTYCIDCGERIVIGKTIAAAGHQWEILEDEGSYGSEICVVCKSVVEWDTICEHTNTALKNKKEAGCTEAGYTGDTYCTDCKIEIGDGESIPAIGHQWDNGSIREEATTLREGVKIYTCKVCGTIRSETLEKIEKIRPELRAEPLVKTYGKKAFKLNVFTDSNGTLTYTSSNKKTASISTKGVVKMKGCGETTITISVAETESCLSVSKKIKLTVIPKRVTLKVVTPYREHLNCSWKKISGINGYEMFVSSNKKFKKASRKILSKNQQSISLKGFKSGETYFVKIRSFKKVGKKTYYSKWSKVKSVKIK